MCDNSWGSGLCLGHGHIRHTGRSQCREGSLAGGPAGCSRGWRSDSLRRGMLSRPHMRTSLGLRSHVILFNPESPAVRKAAYKYNAYVIPFEPYYSYMSYKVSQTQVTPFELFVALPAPSSNVLSPSTVSQTSQHTPC